MTELLQSDSATTAGYNVDDVFDSVEAMDRVCDDPELLAELAELFVPNRDSLMAELGEAIAAQNARGVDEAAHALKGSISTFATKRAYRIARDLEFCGKDNQLDTALQLFEALKTAVAELEAALNSFLATLK